MPVTTNRQVICDTLLLAAAADRDIIVTCSDSRGSGSMTAFAQQYPAQFVEIGIAEQNLVSVSAGMASCGKKVFAVSPACFLSTRSYEQAKVDVAYAHTNVTLIGISGGVSYGALGMTHHSLQDIAAMAALPDMRVYLPSDRHATRSIVTTLLSDQEPAYIRVSRGASLDVHTEATDFSQGAVSVREGTDVVIVACGEMVHPSVQASILLENEGIRAGVLDICRLKPLNEEMILEKVAQARCVITVEEHAPHGGLGSMISRLIGENCPKRIKTLSLPDGHLLAGTQQEVFEYYGLTPLGIANAAKECLA